MEVTCAQSIPVAQWVVGVIFHKVLKLNYILFCTLPWLGFRKSSNESSTLKHHILQVLQNVISCMIYVFVFFSGLQCRKRKLKVSVVAIPKTIDNDILFMDKTFGFDTAVEEAQRAINSAYIEVGCYCSVVCFKMHSQMNMDSTLLFELALLECFPLSLGT